jgi:hypothetical protein
LYLFINLIKCELMYLVSLFYLLKWSGFVATYVIIIFKFSAVSWTGTAAHSGALVANTRMQYQWSCQCDGAAPEVSLPTLLNAEVQVSLFIFKMPLLCVLCAEFINECDRETLSLSLKLLNEFEQNLLLGSECFHMTCINLIF